MKFVILAAIVAVSSFSAFGQELKDQAHGGLQFINQYVDFSEATMSKSKATALRNINEYILQLEEENGLSSLDRCNAKNAHESIKSLGDISKFKGDMIILKANASLMLEGYMRLLEANGKANKALKDLCAAYAD